MNSKKIDTSYHEYYTPSDMSLHDVNLFHYDSPDYEKFFEEHKHLTKIHENQKEYNKNVYRGMVRYLFKDSFFKFMPLELENILIDKFEFSSYKELSGIAWKYYIDNNLVTSKKFKNREN